LFIAIDDTDGRNGGCTTHVMLRILSDLGLTVRELPRLVRLNPNIPFKTRGNAALCAEVGTSGAPGRKIGEYRGKPIFSSEEVLDIQDPEELAERAWKIVTQDARVEDEKTNPGLIVAGERPDASFYMQAVRSVVSLDTVREKIREMQLVHRFAKNGRGLIGALSALSWPAERSTFELIVYDDPSPPVLPYDLKRRVANFADQFAGTFSNFDGENRHAAIFPSPRTPVLCGIRTSDPSDIIDFPEQMSQNFNVHYTGYLLFQTNQATDDHYQHRFGSFEEFSSYAFNAVVLTKPFSKRGGHWFFNYSFGGKEYMAAIFEPSKGLRALVKDLEIGDYLTIFGSFMNGKINLEKVRVIERARTFIRTNPCCPNCGSGMFNAGRNTFVCPECHTRAYLPEYTEIRRDCSRFYYEAPIAGRRHLVSSEPEVYNTA